MKLGLLAAAWLSGLFLGMSSGFGLSAALVLAGGAAFIAVALWLARSPAFPAVMAAVLLLGVARGESSQLSHITAAVFEGREVTAAGRIVDDPESAGTRTRFELLISDVGTEGSAPAAGGRWLVYARPNDELVSRRADPYFRYGDEVVITGTPREPEPVDGFDYPAYLAAQGITATVFAREAQVTGEGGSAWRTAIYAARGRLADSIERSLPYPESALGQALLLGRRGSLPEELVERFRSTGAAHLLAISGLHVGVVLAVTLGTSAWLMGRQRPTYLVFAAAAVWGYALVAGAPPSALRAATMGTVYLAALAVGRPSSALPALALAAALMTAASPNLAKQVSFQLSFAAVAGIALSLAMLGGMLSGWRSPSAGWLARLLSGGAALAVVSGAATLATWPLVAANFGAVALLGVPVSLLAIPAMAPAVVATMAAAAGGLVFEPLGQFLGWIAVAPLGYLIAVVSAFPGWTVEAAWVGKPLLLGWYGALGVTLLAAQRHRTRRWRQAVASVPGWVKSRLSGSHREGDGGKSEGAQGMGVKLPGLRFTIAAAVALCIAAAILWTRATGGPDGLLHVFFLDVGQGDSILVVTPAGRQVLIDGGPDGDIVSQELSAVMPGGDRSLDLVVMTHLDSDHSQGLLEVLDRYTVGAVLSGPIADDGQMSAEWEQRLTNHGIVPLDVSEGYTIELGGGVEAAVLNPRRGHLLGEANNDSVVLRLTYGEISFLLTADIEIEAEERLVEGGEGVASTVLKVGHHGSKTSNSASFLGAVSPSVAIVSAGVDNRHGHPSPEVMERLEAEVGTDGVYRTDLHGSVELISDGKAVWVNWER